MTLTKSARPSIRSALTGHSTTRSSASSAPRPAQSRACMRVQNSRTVAAGSGTSPGAVGSIGSIGFMRAS
ncbi:hypothetical protein [Streptomyces sp. H23]|uniref:hypothetical protein n=1 Tax=Streptomyces sp. H23 TaxID=2541723 RepID=UPI001F10D5A7|nr:hypothetical protein [Streptomyces sp. H23]